VFLDDREVVRGGKFLDRGDVRAVGTKLFSTLAFNTSALPRRRSTLTSSRSPGSAFATAFAPGNG
jgi:hypothetical protein